MWAVGIAHMLCKGTRENNNFCFLIFMMVMVKSYLFFKFGKWYNWDPLLVVYQEPQDTICSPKTISLKLDADLLLYLCVHWIDQRIISIARTVSFSFNQHRLEPTNTLIYGKKPTRAIVGGMAGENPASRLPPEGSLESLARLTSGNMSSGLILVSDICSLH